MARRRSVLHRRRQPRSGATPAPLPLPPNGAVSGRARETMPAKGRPACCAATLSTSVMDGGTVLVLTRHTVDCPVWAAR